MYALSNQILYGEESDPNGLDDEPEDSNMNHLNTFFFMQTLDTKYIIHTSEVQILFNTGRIYNPRPPLYYVRVDGLPLFPKAQNVRKGANLYIYIVILDWSNPDIF